jgi:leader peptidase (prepilin peptidase)/N-methyltransferase
MTSPEIQTYLPVADLVALLFGLCVGSFLNVLALRSLEERSIFWPPSHCPRCKHRLSILDNIPLLSYILLHGRCRYCGGSISLQYPLVELFTALTFVAVVNVFLNPAASPFNNDYWNGLVGYMLGAPPNQTLDFNSKDIQYRLALMGGALIFASTLIAVTVTDFKEKLIPHEITYPSMIIGILFSAIIRQDLLGAMAGIGASYILFDFLAFYGLKVYLAMHGQDETAGRQRRLKRRLPPRFRRRLNSRLRWRLDLATINKQESTEQMEVMGGGDAVLSAVMAAYLGWQLLILALLAGFLIGTIFGMALLINEMKNARILHNCLKPLLIWGGLMGGGFGSLGLTFDLFLNAGTHTALPLALLGALSGCLLAVVSIGTRVSKPYPFGPALAAGGFVAMFLLPNWSIFH